MKGAEVIKSNHELSFHRPLFFELFNVQCEPSMRLIALVVAVLCCALPINACVAQVANPGFEKNSVRTPGLPEGWFLVGTPSSVTRDDVNKKSGSWSVRLQKSGDFVGLGQVMAAAPLRGRNVRLHAELKGQEIGDGNAGLWLRGDDAQGHQTFFVTSYGEPIRGTTPWQTRQLDAVVPETSERLVFGPALAATGVLWVDDVSLASVEAGSAPPLSPAAESYLEAAMAMIRLKAYYSDRVDWPLATAQARLIASGAKDPHGTYEAITHLLAALGDHHSRFLAPNRARAIDANASPGRLGVVSTVVNRHGYLAVPGYIGGNEERKADYVAALRKGFTAKESVDACGWIVDLRSNGGGNMYPMLAGLSPLLGTETLGYFLHQANRTPWTALAAEPSSARDLRRPVAVLIGPRTASSGEATLISFIGRPSTRTFGQASGGFSTANSTFPLSDGAVLVITTALMADRNGRVYGGPIAPDQGVGSVADNAQASITGATIDAASQWLDTQPPCIRAAAGY